MFSTLPRPIALLVEDSDDDAFFFSRTLRLAGFNGHLIHLTDGAAALAHLRKCRENPAATPPPDLVFLDLKIPTFSGFEVLQWLRNNPFDPALEVAVLSGSEHAGDVERALGLGASTYYVKPILVQQLRSRFAAWEARHAATGSSVGRVDPAAGDLGPA